MNDKKKKTAYTFKDLPGSLRRALLCPECGESIVNEDIEQYPNCPYCGKHFAITNDLEDFILRPFLDHWLISGQRVPPDSISTRP